MSYQNICVFCGASESIDLKYREVAERFGQELGKMNRHLIYGGGGSGLMGVVSRAAKASGAKVTGVFPKTIDRIEPLSHHIDELILVDDLFKRKEIMLEKADAFVILPGGFGTLDELFEVVTLKNLRVDDIFKKPVFILNQDNFWDLLIKLCEKIINEKFASPEMGVNYEFLNSIEEIMERIR